MLVFLLVFYFISRRFVFDWWFWLTLAGFLTGLFIGILKFKLKFYETFEAFFLGFVIWLSLYFLEDAIKNSSLPSFLAFVVVMVFVGLYNYFEMHYKNFVWYSSGKVGFSGVTTAAFFFLARALVSSFYSFVLSFVPKYEVFIAGITSFIFFLLTYNLSRSRT